MPSISLCAGGPPTPAAAATIAIYCCWCLLATQSYVIVLSCSDGDAREGLLVPIYLNQWDLRSSPCVQRIPCCTCVLVHMFVRVPQPRSSSQLCIRYIQQCTSSGSAVSSHLALGWHPSAESCISSCSFSTRSWLVGFLLSSCMHVQNVCATECGAPKVSHLIRC